MDLSFSPEERRFRDEMRQRIRDLLPDSVRDEQRQSMTFVSPISAQRRWFAILDAQGLGATHWPVEYGGKDWTALQQFIFEDEIYKAGAPEFNWIGSHMVAPVLYTFGSDAQRARHLGPIRNGQHIWAQGFSEPGAGSDLVSLKTYAELRDDHYVISGQKIWTSGAYEADWGFFLVKTDRTIKPQLGVSFILVDLKTPGITIRRIPEINGEAHLCEVFLDEVKVPKDNLVGEAGKGWTYAKFLLDHERTASSFIYWNKLELDRCYRIARRERRGGRAHIEDKAIQARLARLDAEVLALEWSVLRVLADERSDYPPSAAASVLKLRGADLQQALTECQMDLLGPASLRHFDPYLTPPALQPPWPDELPGRTSTALIMRAATIYGGTKQVQKNILARIAFGL